MTTPIQQVELELAAQYGARTAERMVRHYSTVYDMLTRVYCDRIDNPCPEPIQQGDEYYCVKCSRRWDTHEDKPKCERSL